jgi:hypothetical protein
MTTMAKHDTLFIDLWKTPRDESWREWLKEQARNGMTWEWEAQPIADQIKLTKCTNVPEELPPWLERR